MNRRFECWRDEDGDGVSLCFATVDRIAEQRTSGLLPASAVFLYAFEAGTWFEAMSEHYRRQGWKPYSAPLMPDGTPDESVHDPLPEAERDEPSVATCVDDLRAALHEVARLTAAANVQAAKIARLEAAHDLEKRAHERTWLHKARTQDQLALAMAWGAEACAESADDRTRAAHWRGAAREAGRGADAVRERAMVAEAALATARMDIAVLARRYTAEVDAVTARDEGAAAMREAAVNALRGLASTSWTTVPGADLRRAADAIEALPLRGPAENVHDPLPRGD